MVVPFRSLSTSRDGPSTYPSSTLRGVTVSLRRRKRARSSSGRNLIEGPTNSSTCPRTGRARAKTTPASPASAQAKPTSCQGTPPPWTSTESENAADKQRPAHPRRGRRHHLHGRRRPYLHTVAGEGLHKLLVPWTRLACPVGAHEATVSAKRARSQWLATSSTISAAASNSAQRALLATRRRHVSSLSGAGGVSSLSR